MSPGTLAGADGGGAAAESGGAAFDSGWAAAGSGGPAFDSGGAGGDDGAPGNGATDGDGAPGEGEEPDAEQRPPPAQADDPEDAPTDSLLAKAEAYATALAALHKAREAAAGDAPLTAALPHLRVLRPALETLEAEHAAVEAQMLLLQAEARRIRPARLAGALARLGEQLPQEVAAIRLVTLAPSRWRHLADPAPFGTAVKLGFPEAGYDIEEAALCLAFSRPSAAAFHCMRIVECGLARLGTTLRSDLPGEDRHWTRIMASLRGAMAADRAGAPAARRAGVRTGRAGVRAERAGVLTGGAGVLTALEQVRRCWRGARLVLAEKYTEDEAERLFRAVGTFMAALAGLAPSEAAQG